MGCSNKENKNLPESIHMAVATDLHVIDPTLIENKELYDDISLNNGDGRLLNYSPEITEIFINQMIKEKPEFVILTGDLTLEGEKQSHQWLALQLERLIKEGIQPLVIPGNHDILNPSSRTYGSPSEFVLTVSPEEFSSIYQNCGYKNALYKDPHSLSYVYELRDNAWILMLDTSRYQENTSLGAEHTGALRTETFDWIEEIGKIAKEKGVELISSTHHNIIKHNEFFDSSYTCLNTLKIQRIFDEQNIRINLSGHIHAQTIAQKELGNGLITDICSSSLLVYTNQYGDITYTPFDSFNYQTKDIDVELWATENSNDVNLLNFENYSYDYFKASSTSRSSSKFTDKNYTPEQIAALKDAKGTLNCYYFAGTINEIRDEFMQSEFYAWLIEQDDDTKSYIKSMLAKSDINPTNISINLK